MKHSLRYIKTATDNVIALITFCLDNDINYHDINGNIFIFEVEDKNVKILELLQDVDFPIWEVNENENPDTYEDEDEN